MHRHQDTTSSVQADPSVGGSLTHTFVVRLWETPEPPVGNRTRASAVSCPSTCGPATPSPSAAQMRCLPSCRRQREGIRARRGELRGTLAGAFREGPLPLPRPRDASSAALRSSAASRGHAGRSRRTRRRPVGTTRSFALRRSRSRFLRASAPKTLATLGHSAAATTERRARAGRSTASSRQRFYATGRVRARRAASTRPGPHSHRDGR